MRTLAIILASLLTPMIAHADPKGPAPGPVHIYGSEAAGCIAGAVQLPDSGEGYSEVRQSRSSFWGHPATVAAVEELAQRAHQAGLGELYIGDVSGPRGGPLSGGHAAHTIGLDVDIYLDTAPKPPLSASARQNIEEASVVAPDGKGVDPARWNPGIVTLLHLATQLPNVDRVLVNPAIKRQLCRDVTGDRSWLRFIRPWWGHTAHMHVHFKCPADQPDCVQQAPPPPGESCDATLDWWFAQIKPAPATPPPPTPAHAPPRMPPACRAVMQAP